MVVALCSAPGLVAGVPANVMGDDLGHKCRQVMHAPTDAFLSCWQSLLISFLRKKQVN